MALGDVQDPNAGRLSRAQAGPEVRTATTRAHTVQVDPLTQEIIKQSSEITSAELSKELQKDRLRGATMARAGKTMQDVRDDAPWVEGIFGTGATVQGAQIETMKKAQEDYALDLIENSEDYQKMNPDEFAEHQTMQLEGMLTGDADTDNMMYLMSEEMFAKGAQEHMKIHLPYVQQQMLSAYTSRLDSAASAYEQAMEGALNDEEREQLTAEFIENNLTPPQGINDSTYQTAISGTVQTHMKDGFEHMRDAVELAGIQLTDKQQHAITGTELQWSAANAKRNAIVLGERIDDLIERADAGEDEASLLAGIQLMEEQQGHKYKMPVGTVVRILDTARNARNRALQGSQERRVSAAWIQGADLSAAPVSEMNAAAHDNYIGIFHSTPSDDPRAGKLKKQYAEMAALHTLKLPFAERMLDRAMQNPLHGPDGAVNPNLAEVYDLLSTIKTHEPSYFNAQFPEVVGKMALIEEQLQSSGGSWQQVGQVLHNERERQFDFHAEMPPTAKEEMTSVVDDIVTNSTWFTDDVHEDVQSLASVRLQSQYERFYSGHGSPTQAAAQTQNYADRNFKTVNGYLIDMQNQDLNKVMGLPSGRDAEALLGRALDKFERELPPGATAIPPAFVPSTGTMTYQVFPEGSHIPRMHTISLKQIGAEAEAIRKNHIKINATAAHEAAYEEEYSDANAWATANAPELLNHEDPLAVIDAYREHQDTGVTGLTGIMNWVGTGFGTDPDADDFGLSSLAQGQEALNRERREKIRKGTDSIRAAIQTGSPRPFQFNNR